MSKPKTVKSFLKMCKDICETDRDELKGAYNLSEDEYRLLGNIRAVVQNELSDNNINIMEKFNIK